MKAGTFIGGLGDFILSMDIIAQKYDIVDFYSHQKSLSDLIIESSQYFKGRYTFISNSLNHIPYHTQYPIISEYGMYSNILSERARLSSKNTICLHRRGSKYHNTYVSAKGKIGKDLPRQFVLDFIHYCIGNSKKVILLGQEEDYKDLPEGLYNSMPIWDQIDHTISCEYFVGADSFFKTVRLAAGLSATVFVANHEDLLRDKKFLNPYEQEGLLTRIDFDLEEDITMDKALCYM